MTRHPDPFGFEFFSDECEKCISPHLLEGIMVDVFSFNSQLVRGGDSSDSRGEMEMEISLEVPAKGVDGEIDARDESLLFCQFLDNAGGYRRRFVHEMTVDPE